MLNHVSDNDTARYIIIEVYKNHLSVTKIKQIFGKNTITNSFTFHSIAQSHVATLLKQTDIKKTAGLEKIQPNLVNLLVSILYGSLTKTINDSLSSGIFPYAAKIAAVSPINKDTGKKLAFLILGL